MKEIQIGIMKEMKMLVKEEHLACNVGSGDLPVLSTPMLIAFMEKASSACLETFLEEGESSVGTLVNVQHLAATAVDRQVKVHAEIVEVDRKRVVFYVEAYDDKQRIGTGSHERFIINSEHFMNKTNQK